MLLTWACLQLVSVYHVLMLAWLQDKVASDSMEPALQAMRLGRLVRSAVRLVKGVRIRLYDGCFEMAVYSAIPWFKVGHCSAFGVLHHAHFCACRQI